MSGKKSKKQKLYRMKGCSRNNTCKRRYKGGYSDKYNLVLAYPATNIHSVPNPNLAYTGKGGSNCDNITPNNLAINTNTNGSNPLYPNTGPAPTGFNFLNSSAQRGGSCGGVCSGINVIGQTGGSHRNGCRCSNCKKNHKMRGGSGNNGIPYPNGLTGQPWSGSGNWPGTSNIDANYNHYSLNTYNNDVSRQMRDTGPFPFNYMGGKNKKRKMKGGNLTNFLAQDLINLGRQISYNAGSAYNAIQGYSAPTNPLPWKDQLVGKNYV